MGLWVVTSRPLAGGRMQGSPRGDTLPTPRASAGLRLNLGEPALRWPHRGEELGVFTE